MKATIDYNGQKYTIPEGEDRQGAGSMKDLADDFAFEVATDLKLRYGSDEFNKSVRIIRKAFYKLITDGILNALPTMPPQPKKNLPILLPPQNKEVPLWVS